MDTKTIFLFLYLMFTSVFMGFFLFALAVGGAEGQKTLVIHTDYLSIVIFSIVGIMTIQVYRSAFASLKNIRFRMLYTLLVSTFGFLLLLYVFT
ncbi:hypothetical protein JFL43_18605 [Viridibacillus sp. YIM B01967]|uniref:Uncharacterized protein n=1 Tax=Viridibacillus soli TaxID=2798301 RepID=A0ABS1HBL3_9BACL|nr:hypothetical protein [Viridibacillus soli]MBK3496835.1 hypothetical protein [Viridibacillus soli]